jgi:hypothetical protein
LVLLRFQFIQNLYGLSFNLKPRPVTRKPFGVAPGNFSFQLGFLPLESLSLVAIRELMVQPQINGVKFGAGEG